MRCDLSSAPWKLWLGTSELSAEISLAGKKRKTTKASEFSDAQKAFIFKQGVDGMPVAVIGRRAGISPAMYFSWKKKCDGLPPTEMKRLMKLEDANGRLMKRVADMSLDQEMLEHVIRSKL